MGGVSQKIQTGSHPSGMDANGVTSQSSKARVSLGKCECERVRGRRQSPEEETE